MRGELKNVVLAFVKGAISGFEVFVVFAFVVSFLSLLFFWPVFLYLYFSFSLEFATVILLLWWLVLK